MKLNVRRSMLNIVFVFYWKTNHSISIRYGIANVHLIETIQHGPSSIRLNVTADNPILSTKTSLIYNYTALLTGEIASHSLWFSSEEKRPKRISIYIGEFVFSRGFVSNEIGYGKFPNNSFLFVVVIGHITH